MTETMDTFDWWDSPDVCIREQPPIAVYANNGGSITIRQRYDEAPDDIIVVVLPDRIPALIAALETYLPGHQQKRITHQRGVNAQSDLLAEVRQ